MSHIVIHQYKLPKARVIVRILRLYFVFGIAGWFGNCIRIKCRPFNLSAARPESSATAFIRVRFACDRISSFTFWRAPPGKAGHSEIKTAAKEMHRADLPPKPGTEFLENGIGFEE